ncbi:hypothetical protein [Priestia flexa]|uniref:hypothetical protein n=1 Tax=Priestia flexa TaxID=86664 RepID=UPI002490A85A|nr:hypothetical protein [Priestia flexa]
MTNDIIVSIKPKYCDLIKSRKKFNEFRNFIPKRGVPKNIWVYETAPVSSLKYLMIVDLPVQFPEKVDVRGYMDEEFNSGLMHYKIAYPILEFYELSNPLNREELLNIYNFKGPQAYIYLDSYPLLNKYLIEINKIKIF